jgi:hypothetical protein
MRLLLQMLRLVQSFGIAYWNWKQNENQVWPLAVENVSLNYIVSILPCIATFIASLIFLDPCIIVQGDSFGTRPKKMRISQRLFISLMFPGPCIFIYSNK